METMPFSPSRCRSRWTASPGWLRWWTTRSRKKRNSNRVRIGLSSRIPSRLSENPCCGWLRWGRSVAVLCKPDLYDVLRIDEVADPEDDAPAAGERRFDRLGSEQLDLMDRTSGEAAEEQGESRSALLEMSDDEGVGSLRFNA
jgi:hypothetical protein